MIRQVGPNFTVYRAIEVLNEQLAGTLLYVEARHGYAGDVRRLVYRCEKTLYGPLAVVQLIFGMNGLKFCGLWKKLLRLRRKQAREQSLRISGLSAVWKASSKNL